MPRRLSVQAPTGSNRGPRPKRRARGPRRCPWGAGRGRHLNCLPLLARPVNALIPVEELLTPIEGTETLQLEGREVRRQAPLGRQLFGSELVCQVQTVTL